MTAVIGAGFRGSISGTVSASGISLADGFWAPRAFTLGTRTYQDLPAALEAEMETVVGPGNVTVSWNATTGNYAIQFAGSETLTWDADSAAILGMATSIGPGTSFPSTITPRYVMVGAQGALSAVSDEYEAENITEGRITEDGTPYNVSATGAALQFECEFPMEPIEAVFARKASVSAPWTWQHFFAHVRGSHPFVLEDGTDSRVCVLRPDGTRFVPRRVVPDWDGQWVIPLQTNLLGYL